MQRHSISRGIVLQLSNTATERGKDNAAVKTAREGGRNTHDMSGGCYYDKFYTEYLCVDEAGSCLMS